MFDKCKKCGSYRVDINGVCMNCGHYEIYINNVFTNLNYETLVQTYTLSNGNTTESYAEKLFDDEGLYINKDNSMYKQMGILIEFIRKFESDEEDWDLIERITFYLDGSYSARKVDYYCGEFTTTGLKVTPALHKAITEQLKELEEK